METSIVKLRQARNGSFFIEINGGAESAEVVRAEVDRSLGSESLVRKMRNSTIVELRDLNGTTTPNEIVDAIFRETGVCLTDSKVLSIRKTYGGA